MVHFFIVLAVCVVIFLIVVSIDHWRGNRALKRLAAEAKLPLEIRRLEHKTDKQLPDVLPPLGTLNRYDGFDFRRVKKVGNYFAYGWVPRKRGAA